MKLRYVILAAATAFAAACNSQEPGVTEPDPEAAAHHPRIDVNGNDRFGIDRRLPAEIVDRLSRQPGATVVEHTVFPARFACPNLVLHSADGLNHGISDVMSPWSAAIAELGSNPGPL